MNTKRILIAMAVVMIGAGCPTVPITPPDDRTPTEQLREVQIELRYTEQHLTLHLALEPPFASECWHEWEGMRDRLQHDVWDGLEVLNALVNEHGFEIMRPLTCRDGGSGI